MNIAALIPMKGFRNAKQRLAPVLSGAARETLAETMFRDVLRQVRIARGLSATFVVTADDRVAAIAAAAGAEVIRETEENGETSAVDFARLELKSAGCEAVLILPGDLPLLRAIDVEQTIAQIPPGATGPFALLVPSHDQLGTNGLILAPPDVIKLRFGFDSFTFHMSQVTAQGLPIRFLKNDRLALDIDEPKDLYRFLGYGLSDGESTQVALDLLRPQTTRKNRSFGGA
jgi:2-phospho-L-lactate guanylyltransferase